MAGRRVTGVVLAGGLGRRMSADGQGLDKSRIAFRQRPLIEHVIERLAPQVDALLVNTPVPPDEAASWWPVPTTLDIAVVADDLPGRVGPLAGIHAALAAARTDWIASVPCDAPFLPLDLVTRLGAALDAAPGSLLAVASADGRRQPVFLLVHRSLRPSIEAYLAAGGRAVEPWLAQHGAAEAVFDESRGFVNLNTREQMQHHEFP